MTQQLYDSSMNQRTGFLGFIGNSDTSFEKMYKLEPGNYILEQESTYSATQPCSSILVNIQPPTSISSGTPLNGNISQAGKREYYTFNGTSGQAMTIKVTAGGGLVGNTRVIQPYGVGYEFYQGTIVKPSLPFGTAFSFTPSSSGTFEIEVDGDGSSTGTYSIALN